MKPKHYRNNDRNRNNDRKNHDNRGHKPVQKKQDPNVITSSGRVRMMFGFVDNQIEPPYITNDVVTYGIGGFIKIRDRRREVKDIAQQYQELAYKLREQEKAAVASQAIANAKQKLLAMTAAAEFDKGLLPKVEEAERELAEVMSAHEETLEEARQVLETALASFREAALADATLAIRKEQGNFVLEFSAPTSKACEFLFFRELDLIQVYEELGLVGADLKPRMFHVSGQVDRGFFRIYPISAERIVLMALCSQAKEYVVEQEHLFYHGGDRCPALLRINASNNLLWEVVNLGTGQSHGTIGEKKRVSKTATDKKEWKSVSEQGQSSEKAAPKQQPKKADQPKPKRVYDDSNVPVGTSLGDKLREVQLAKPSDKAVMEEVKPEPTVVQEEVPVQGGNKKAANDEKKAAKKKAAKK